MPKTENHVVNSQCFDSFSNSQLVRRSHFI